jgi:hypothetical protein
MKGKEPAVSKELQNAWWDIVVKDEAEDFGERGETAVVVGLVGGGEAKGLERVCEIAERAVCCARLEQAKCLMDDVGGEWDARLIPSAVTCGASVSATDARWV